MRPSFSKLRGPPRPATSCAAVPGPAVVYGPGRSGPRPDGVRSRPIERVTDARSQSFKRPRLSGAPLPGLVQCAQAEQNLPRLAIGSCSDSRSESVTVSAAMSLRGPRGDGPAQLGRGAASIDAPGDGRIRSTGLATCQGVEATYSSQTCVLLLSAFVLSASALSAFTRFRILGACSWHGRPRESAQ